MAWLADQEEPVRAREAWRIVTNKGDYTVICTQNELMNFQRIYIQNLQAQGIDLRDIKFMWDRTRIVPLHGVR